MLSRHGALLADDLMRQHCQALARLRRSGDVLRLAALLHESLYRHQGDIANPQVYKLAGRQNLALVEDYLAEVLKCIAFIADENSSDVSREKKLALLERARKNLGQSALLLSGGASMGFFHLGVVKCLLDNQVLPRVICGASIGSLIAGGMCARSDDELVSLFDNLQEIYRIGLRLLRPSVMWRQRAVLDQVQLEHCAIQNMGMPTFAEAAKHSGRQFCVSVSPSRARQKPRVLSPVTAPDVLVTSAIIASCAIPGLFPPVKLKARNAAGAVVPYLPQESWVDGTFQGDLPMKRLGRLFNVNHFIVSQVNPHAIPFLVSRHGRGALALASDLALSSARAQTAQTLKILQARVRSPSWHNILEHGRQIAEQHYKGDINIHPPLSPWLYRNVFSNPSIDDLHRYIAMGEQATTPMIPQIRNQLRVPQAVEAAIKRLSQA